MYPNQILSYFDIVYPKRISSNTNNDSIKRADFRKLALNFKLNDQIRLVINTLFIKYKYILINYKNLLMFISPLILYNFKTKI